MESFAFIVNGSRPLIIIIKHSILDLCMSPGYTYEYTTEYTILNFIKYLQVYSNMYLTSLITGSRNFFRDLDTTEILYLFFYIVLHYFIFDLRC